MSQPSEGDDTAEPVSRMMPRTQRTYNEHGEEILEEIDEDEYDLPPMEKGDLDDIPNDYEMNIEGYCLVARAPWSASSVDGEPQSSVITSSLVRPVEKSYVKMEVINSKQIRHWICIFNLFVFVATIYTLTYVVLANSRFLVGFQMQYPAPLLSEDQKAQYNPRFVAVPPALYPRLNISPSPTPTSGRSPQPGVRQFLSQKGVSHVAKSKGSDEIVLDTWPLPSVYAEFFRHLMKCEGIDMTYNGFATDVDPSTVLDCPSSSDPNVAPSTRTWIVSPNDSLPETDSYLSTVSRRAGAPSPLPIVALQRGTPYIQVYLTPLERAEASKELRRATYIPRIVLGCFVLALTVIYAVRISRMGRDNITHEQIWMLFLLVVSNFYFNIIECGMTLKEISVPDFQKTYSPGLIKAAEILGILGKLGFTASSYFYLWISLHGYRILNPREKIKFVSFYLPKILVMLPYAIGIPLLFVEYDVAFTETPLLSAPAAAYYYGHLRVFEWLPFEFSIAIVKSLYELVLTTIILLEGRKTMRVIQDIPYMKYRSKRVGFRYFMYINFVFYLLFIVLQAVLHFGYPRGSKVLELQYIFNEFHVEVDPTYTAGPFILYAGYLFCMTYFHLPHDSDHWFLGWFVGNTKPKKMSKHSSKPYESEKEISSSENDNIDGVLADPSFSAPTSGDTSTPWASEPKTGGFTVSSGVHTMRDYESEFKRDTYKPFTYQKKESKDSEEVKPNCFTMQTHVILFNFAWYVYYYGTPKLDNFRPKKNPLPFEHRIAKFVNSRETDTQALVVDCSDRIIVTFKGTTTMRNLRTSLQVNQMPIAKVLRMNANGDDEWAILAMRFDEFYIRGKMHKGFADAYLSVADEITYEVQRLRAEKKRPVFLTGHSLGGALATVCSLDLWVKLNLSARDIIVSTFGSPRVGNWQFAAMYDKVLPVNWRIVVEPDMIAKLPSVGYKHVGRKVVLTPHGELIIDPSDLERRPWSGEAAGFAYHRKASYLLAMRAWCVRNHRRTYTPVFWPFPVRPEDERRFAGAFEDLGESRRGRRVAAKIIRMDAMVDALDRDDTGLANMAVIQKWERLTRRARLHNKLMGKQRPAEFM